MFFAALAVTIVYFQVASVVYEKLLEDLTTTERYQLAPKAFQVSCLWPIVWPFIVTINR